MTLKKILLLSVIAIHFFSNTYCMKRNITGPEKRVSFTQKQGINSYIKAKEPAYAYNEPCDCCSCCVICCAVGLTVLVDYTSRHNVIEDFNNYFNPT